MANGKSIRIYLENGNPSGIKHAEIVNMTIQGIMCPRSLFAELKNWNEAKRPGVYFLFGEDDKTNDKEIYIGEAEVVLNRLGDHISGKEFWTNLVIFTSKDDNLTKSHVKYLESKLIDMAKNAERYKLRNYNSPQLTSLPRADKDAMEEFIEAIRLLLGVFGHKVIDSLVPKATNNIAENTSLETCDTDIQNTQIHPYQKYKLKVKSITANAVKTEEGLVVLSQSQATNKPRKSLSGGYRLLRKKLIDDGTLQESGSNLAFTKDILFSSPSQAGAIILGYAVNGRDCWKTTDNKTYGDAERDLILA